jgi:GEVED domain/Secretion system C-terminal sorting domain
MFKRIIFIIAIMSFRALSAQENISSNPESQSGYIVADEFHVTRPLREIFADQSQFEDIYKEGESEDKKMREPQKFPFTVEKDGAAYGNDPSSMQRDGGKTDAGQTRVNWAGQTASGFRPMDPSGAVGPNHYIQMINATVFKVYNKTTGATMLTATLGNLWSSPTPNDGDPIVLYDKAADRWFLAQFGISNNRIYIAVSTTADPLGSYYTYTFTSPQFPDYLKFSVWQDGYYMTSNQTTQKVFAFERSAMLVGTPGARSVYATYSPPTGGFFCPLAGDASDGVLPPTGTPCPIMSYSDNAWGGGATDAVRIYNMTVNWVPTVPTATITSNATIATAAFDASYSASWNDCSQPGTTQKLDGIGGVLMYRAQWKTWSGYNSVVLNWAVRISATQRSIKWCELRQNQSTGVWTLYQEGIYTPDTDTRWMGSIAMDSNGSIGICYVKSNPSSTYPGIYYTGRRTCDPLGTLPVTEVQIVAGTSYQTGGNRFGDYAQLTLDPDGLTFWGTSEYMGGSNGASAARTRIFSFQIAPCNVTASVAVAITTGATPACAGTSLTFTATPTNGGSAPTYQWQVNGVNVGTNSATYTSSSLTNGAVVTCIMTSNASGVVGSPATSNSITITINPTLTPSNAIAISSGSNPMCSGANATFTATATNGGTTPIYQWQVNGVNVGTNSPTYSSTTLANGQTVTCILTSNALCASPSNATSNSIVMTVNTCLTAGVTIAQTGGSNPLCAGELATFTATASNGGNSPSYQWQVNGINVGTNSATYSASNLNNNDVVTCILTSNLPNVLGSPSTSNTLTIVVTTPVTPSNVISISSGSNPMCEGASVTFVATATNAGTAPNYQWTIDGVNVGTNQNSFATTSLQNGQIVSCTLTSNLTCVTSTNANSNQITASVNPTITPTVSIVISAGSNPSNAGQPVSFTATAVNGGTTPTYTWLVNGLNVGITGETFTTTTLVEGDVVSCVLTSSANCVSSTTATSNTISMSVIGETLPCIGNSGSTSNEYIAQVSIGTMSNVTGASTYSNYSNIVSSVNIGLAFNVTINIGNAYSTDLVRIWCDWNQNGIFTDPGEFVYTSSAGVGPHVANITPPASAILGNALMRIRLSDSSQGDVSEPCGTSSFGEVEDYTLLIQDGIGISELPPSLQSIGSEGIAVYPNPSIGNVNIQGIRDGVYYLTDATGRLVEVVRLNSKNQYTVQLNGLASGSYILSGQNDFGVVKQKIIVE